MSHREHPNEDELLRFASRELKPSDRTAIMRHLQICRSCNTQYHNLCADYRFDTVPPVITLHEGNETERAQSA